MLTIPDGNQKYKKITKILAVEPLIRFQVPIFRNRTLTTIGSGGQESNLCVSLTHNR